jgi:hypothetical protein
LKLFKGCLHLPYERKMLAEMLTHQNRRLIAILREISNCIMHMKVFNFLQRLEL